jgi:hypothetical protein
MVSLAATKRVIKLPADSKLENLREHFMEVFNDVIPADTMATEYIFQWFEPRFEEYVELDVEQELCDGTKVIVQLEKLKELTVNDDSFLPVRLKHFEISLFDHSVYLHRDPKLILCFKNK